MLVNPKRKIPYKTRAMTYKKLTEQSVDMLTNLDKLLPKVQPINEEDYVSLEKAKIQLTFFLALLKRTIKEIETM